MGVDINVAPDKREVIFNHEGEMLCQLRIALNTLWDHSRGQFDARQSLTTSQGSSITVSPHVHSDANGDENQPSKVCHDDVNTSPVVPNSIAAQNSQPLLNTVIDTSNIVATKPFLASM